MIHFITRQTSLNLDNRIRVLPDLREALLWLNTLSVVGVDCETTGLNFLDDKILLVQLGNKDRQIVVDATTIDILPLKPLLESRTVKKLGHNLGFDYKFLKRAGIVMDNLYDTMLAEQVIHCGKDMKFGLAPVMQYRLGRFMDKQQQMTFVKFDGRFKTDQIVYAAKDIEPLEEIARLQKADIDTYQLSKVVALENNAVMAFADIEFEGMMMDEAAWLANVEPSKALVVELKARLFDTLQDDPTFAEFVPRSFNLSIFDDVVVARRKALEKSVNFGSPKQVLRIMSKLVDGLEGVGADVLEKHTRIPFIKDYLAFKEAEKLVNAYGEKFLDLRWSDGKVHTSFRQVLDTGRVSSSKPNVQQIPADNRFRNCFTAPEGWVFVSSDFSSQELCVIAEGSHDPVWRQALESGADLHSVCAHLLYKGKWEEAAEPDCAYMATKQKCACKAHKKLRNAVKTINFGLA